MFEALASKEPSHLDFQAAVVISPSLFISKQPTYCRERASPFAATWMDLEIIILSEVRQKTKILDKTI